MAYAGRLPCRYPGCAALVLKSGFCPKHRRQIEAQRGSSRQRGYTHQWSKAARAFLLKYPECRRCFVEHGRSVPATDVDHILPVAKYPELFWDEHNWQGLCHACHSAKTRSEMPSPA